MFSLLLSDEGKNLLKSIIKETITVTLKEFLEEKGINDSLVKSQKGAIQDQYLTRKETSNLLKVSLVTLNNWQKTKILIPSKIGKRVLYKKEDVQKALQEQDPHFKIEHYEE
ncbi:helix-turn-helix domain-containing protein [Chryseobacterium sp.]|uniref:helix-turn-helix domain-containing protein n=1 Tax=Chryseobacterium sp. TaxID=1871047 RepID=UPI000EEA1DB2|nr:helix-turn-helix domain-containing protein [Chryseobacterium sp.]HCA06804.1 hypothetical protein [Chryseobacterium sp.]